MSKPFIAKISEITSRPYTYLVVLVFYVIGYIIVASCQTISAYIVGEVFVAIGSSGLDLTTDIIVADLTPLEWRGFASSMLSTPFIINTWFAGKIVQAINSRNQWRWGYGMFAIIMPFALGPAIAVLICLDRKAKKHGIVNIVSLNATRRDARELADKEGNGAPRGAVIALAAELSRTWMEALKTNLEEIDAFGLVLLGSRLWVVITSAPILVKNLCRWGMEKPLDDRNDGCWRYFPCRLHSPRNIMGSSTERPSSTRFQQDLLDGRHN